VRRPTLSLEQILAWADYERKYTGSWPKTTGDRVVADREEKWRNIDQALRDGNRGLPGGYSLARLLADYRGVRNHVALPNLTEEQIVAWAQAHQRRTGNWPRTDSAREVRGAPGEKWRNIDQALRDGGRGLPGGSSLILLLAERCGARNKSHLPKLSKKRIAAWAKAHHQRTGAWPTMVSGPIADAPGETWTAINHALGDGGRGLPGGDSLARLIARTFGVRNKVSIPPLTLKQIRTWIDAYHRRTGQWPLRNSGPIPGAPGETWMKVETALREGLRGLPGGSSLHRFLKTIQRVKKASATSGNSAKHERPPIRRVNR
jgi:hypothetical protein